ncbi:MAG: NosD domain-containing protein [Armatimonadota bacterium]
MRFKIEIALIILIASMISCNAAETSGASKKPAAPSSQPSVMVYDTPGLLKALSGIDGSTTTITLAPGVYKTKDTITITGKNGVSIVGSGWDTVIQKIGDGDALIIKDCGFTFVRNLRFEGDPKAKTGSGLIIKGACGSDTVDSCMFRGYPVSGLRFEGLDTGAQSSNTVKDCMFIDNAGDQLWSYSNNDFYIVGNTFGVKKRLGRNAPRTGIVLDHSSAGTFAMNKCSGNRIGMRLGPRSNFNRIENNLFRDSLESGMALGVIGGNGCYLTVITGNTVSMNSAAKSGAYPGVDAVNMVQTTFTTNQISCRNSKTRKHKSGLVIGTGCGTWTTKDNIISDNTEKPIVFDESAGHIIKDNITE